MPYDTIHLSSLVSAIIGGLFVLIGGWLTHRHASKRDEVRRQNEVQGVLQAVAVELTVIWKRYMEVVGGDLEKLPNTSPWMVHWDVYHDYFTVFDSNAGRIGQIEEPCLRRAIVKTYVLAKALVDSYKINNNFLGRWEQANSNWRLTGKRDDAKLAHERHEELITYAPKLKYTHQQATAEVEALLKILKEHGVSAE